MAKPEETESIDVALRREEGDLAAWFDAERAETPEASPALIRAILADAAAIAPARRRARRPAWSGLEAWLRPFGGWAGASALAGCLALGVWAGTIGAGGDWLGAAFWGDVVALDGAGDGVDGFFDLAATEG